MTRLPSFIPIPARTPTTKCRGCDEDIYFAPHPSTGRAHPISVSEDGCEAPTPLTDGQGVSHFSNCPKADRFRARK